MRPQTTTAILEVLRNALPRYPGALAWYLLGSAASDQMRPDSDVDLAVMAEPDSPVDSRDLARWAGELALLLGRNVDIGTLDSANLVYTKEALLTGEQICSVDQQQATKRASELLALYLTFQDDRKEVLNAYRAR